MKYLLLCIALLVTGCDRFSIGSHTFQEYERLCKDFGGLDRAHFDLGDNNKVILLELRCKNGVILDYEYVKERFISES